MYIHLVFTGVSIGALAAVLKAGFPACKQKLQNAQRKRRVRTHHRKLTVDSHSSSATKGERTRPTRRCCDSDAMAVEPFVVYNNTTAQPFPNTTMVLAYENDTHYQNAPVGDIDDNGERLHSRSMDSQLECEEMYVNQPVCTTDYSQLLRHPSTDLQHGNDGIYMNELVR